MARGSLMRRRPAAGMRICFVFGSSASRYACKWQIRRTEGSCPIRRSLSMWRRGISADNGVALVIVLMAIILLVALGLMLVLNTLTEVMVAGHYRLAQEAFYAADAAAERGMDELAGSFDWNSVLIGAQQSGFVDGQGPGARTLSDGSTIDLTNATNLLNCGHAAACTPAE